MPLFKKEWVRLQASCRPRWGFVIALLVVGGCSEGTSTEAPRRTEARGMSPERSEPPALPSKSAPGAAAAPEGTLDYTSASREAKATERYFETKIDYSRTIGPRGFGGVLVSGLIPRKILAKARGLFLKDERGAKKSPLKDGVPYFVFEETEGKVLVSSIQDHETALRAGGWVGTDECYPWITRRLAYPKRAGRVTLRVKEASGETKELPGEIQPFDATRMMPWPILAGAPADGWLVVLADLREFGADFTPLKVRTADDYEIYVLYSETELNKALTNLTSLSAVLDSGKMPVSDIPRVFGNFVTQNQADFLDLDELKKTVEIYPGGSPDFLFRGALDARLKRINHVVRGNVEKLERIALSADYRNPSHSVHVIPLRDLEGSKP